MRKFRYILVAACALIAASCQLRPLEQGEESIELQVVVELRTVLNINTAIYNKNLPIPTLKSDMFRVLFYDPDTGKLVNQAFLSEPTKTDDGKDALGGDVTIMPGTYDMVCYNFDMPDTFVDGLEDISTLRAYTNEIPESIKARYTKDGPSDDATVINYEPDHVLVARDIGLVIAPHTGLLVIETEATTVVDTYYLQVRIKGAQYTSSASAVLSGMSPSVHFGANYRDEEKPCSVYFELQKSTDPKIVDDNKDVLCNTFNTFGKIYDKDTKADSDLQIKFNVVRTDGEPFEYVFDMNDIFLTEDALERHWLILNAVIDVPEPDPTPGGGGSGGFNPEVDPWDEEQGEIVI